MSQTPSKAISKTFRKAQSNPADSRCDVTIKPAEHLASPVNVQDRGVNGAEVLRKIRQGYHREILQSSLGKDRDLQDFDISPNGFVNAAIRAYSGHHHLRIRPDDVWLAILTQFSSYINAHAEELRGSFVAHKGKKELVVEYDVFDQHDVDWADFAQKIGVLIQGSVVDPELRSVSLSPVRQAVLKMLVESGCFPPSPPPQRRTASSLTL